MSKQDDELRIKRGLINGLRLLGEKYYGNSLYEQHIQYQHELQSYISTHYIPKAEVLRALNSVRWATKDDVYTENRRQRDMALDDAIEALGLTSKETGE